MKPLYEKTTDELMDDYAPSSEMDAAIDLVKTAIVRMTRANHDQNTMIAVLECYLRYIRTHVTCEVIDPDGFELEQRQNT